MFKIIIWAFWLFIGISASIAKSSIPGLLFSILVFGYFFLKALYDFVKQSNESTQEILRSKLYQSQVVTECPNCKEIMIKAYIEDGSQGDWCPHCKKSLQKMKGKI